MSINWLLCTINEQSVCQLSSQTVVNVTLRDEFVMECKFYGTSWCAEQNLWDRMLATF